MNVDVGVEDNLTTRLRRHPRCALFPYPEAPSMPWLIPPHQSPNLALYGWSQSRFGYEGAFALYGAWLHPGDSFFLESFVSSPTSSETYTDFYHARSVFSNRFQREIKVADIFGLSLVRKAISELKSSGWRP